MSKKVSLTEIGNRTRNQGTTNGLILDAGKSVWAEKRQSTENKKIVALASGTGLFSSINIYTLFSKKSNLNTAIFRLDKI